MGSPKDPPGIFQEGLRVEEHLCSIGKALGSTLGTEKKKIFWVKTKENLEILIIGYLQQSTLILFTTVII